MKSDFVRGTCYESREDTIVILGVSKSAKVSKLRDFGVCDTKIWKYWSVTSADDSIKDSEVTFYVNGDSFYHNTRFSGDDIVIYKSLTDTEGAKCCKISTLEQKMQNSVELEEV